MPVQAVAEDPRLLAAIAESTNPDVVALRNLLNADQEKARKILDHKNQVMDKWKVLCLLGFFVSVSLT